MSLEDEEDDTQSDDGSIQSGDEPGLISKTLHAIGAPQRYVAKKAAQATGLPASEDSQTNFANMADQYGDVLGVPRDSSLGNAVKAGAVAGAEVFADPLSFLPLGKVAAGVKGLHALGALGAVAKIAEHGGAIEKAAQLADKGLMEAAKVSDLTKVRRAKYLASVADAIKTGEKDVQLISSESSRAALQNSGHLAAQGEQELRMAQKASAEARPLSAVEEGNRETAKNKLLAEAIEHVKDMGPEAKQRAAKQFILSNKGRFGL